MRLLTRESSLDNLLEQLICKYDHISFAVAWAGTGTKTYNALKKHRAKIRRAVIGLHFYQTHADVLDEFQGTENVRFVLETNGVFHPKAYLFWNSTAWELLVGSANLTSGGLGRNEELMLHVTSAGTPSKTRISLERQIDIYWKKAATLTQEDVANYRKFWEMQRPILHTWSSAFSGAISGDSSKKATPPLRSATMSMSWDEYLSIIQSAPRNGLKERIEILADSRSAFRNHDTWANMDQDLRKCLAGFPLKPNARWKWFGSMKGAGLYKQAVNANVPHLSNALSAIPLQGDINENHYHGYIKDFTKAFPNGGDGLAVATRLLAMKRPDYFICLDDRNRRRLCQDFGIPVGKKDYQRYWDVIVQRITNSVWWKAPMPVSEPGQSVWLGRAAMLDVIYYDGLGPHKKAVSK